jgi:hypothetical protein
MTQQTIDIKFKDLWESTLGTAPTKEQFAIWAALHSSGIIKQAILKTAMRNQSMNGTMDQDHRLRYASKVMLTLSAQREEHAENREKLRQEFGGNR